MQGYDRALWSALGNLGKWAVSRPLLVAPTAVAAVAGTEGSLAVGTTMADLAMGIYLGDPLNIIISSTTTTTTAAAATTMTAMEGTPSVAVANPPPCCSKACFDWVWPVFYGHSFCRYN